MLLARYREFNTTLSRVASAALIVFALAIAADADEIRRWRDTEGRLHYEIVGDDQDPPPEDREMQYMAGPEMSEEEKFSVATSRKRRELERALKQATADLASVRAAIAETEAKRFIVYTPPAPSDRNEAQFVLDSQRNAFLAAREFDQQKADELRRLRGDERDLLLTVKEIWSDFTALREDVRSRYGKLPGWWRDRLDCSECLSAAQVDQELAKRRRRARRERPTPAPG